MLWNKVVDPYPPDRAMSIFMTVWNEGAWNEEALVERMFTRKLLHTKHAIVIVTINVVVILTVNYYCYYCYYYYDCCYYYYYC